MRKFTIEHTVYNFDELSEEAKREALEKLYDINVDFGWWKFVYEDAETIGLKITEFDIDRGGIDGYLTEDMQDVCKKILAEHGNTSGTYVLAEKNLHRHGYGNEEQFTKDLLEEYLTMLRDEHEYRLSDEAIIETIEANEYEFYEDGRML